MIDRKDWPDFIKSLLATHYDPSYQRSGSIRQARETGIVAATTGADDINRLADAIMTKSTSIDSNRLAAARQNGFVTKQACISVVVMYNRHARLNPR